MRIEFSPLIFAALLCLCGCPLGTPRDHSRPQGHQNMTIAISPADDAILFNASGAGGRDLYLLRLADLKVSRIADTPDYEVSASFASDGQRIVYAAGLPGDRADHIFTIALDGTSKKQLTKSDANDTSPRFSPDGSLIVFVRDKTYIWGGLAANWNDDGVVCVVGADGKGERQLTPDDQVAFEPSFAEDGQSVIYGTYGGLFSVPIDGSESPKMIAPLAERVQLSPNGKQLVYNDGQYSGDQELFVADIDGTDRSQITKSDNGCVHAVFANAGDRVYFLVVEWPQGPMSVPKSSIWTVKTDGTQQQQITDLSLFDSPMNWKPKQLP